MSQQVLEGAWEEIAEHAEELSGKRVKIIVLDETQNILANGAVNQSESSAPVQLKYKDAESLFRNLVDQWRRETSHFSLAIKKFMHPAYQRIIGLGPEAVPLILHELERKPGHWFWALKAITGEDPTRSDDTISEAAQAWLQWGKKRQYI